MSAPAASSRSCRATGSGRTILSSGLHITSANQIVRNGVALAANDGKVRPLRSAPVLVGTTGSERAPWLEPYGGDSEWRQQMWARSSRCTAATPPCLKR